MQCKDIPDRPVLQFLATLNGRWANRFSNEDGTPYNERSILHAMPAGTPDKLALAKMRMLMRRRLVQGCGCGCRGDFELTDKGRELLQQTLEVGPGLQKTDL